MEGGGRAIEDEDARVGLVPWAGITAADEMRWKAMPPVRRSKALARVEALRLYEEDGGMRRVEEALRLAGMSLSNFYAMRARWSKERSLASLGVYARRELSRADGRVDRADKARPHVASILAADPDASPALVEQALARWGLDLPKTSLVRLIRSVRAELPIRAPFGRTLVFDNAGVDLVDMWDRRQRFYAVVDAETGLVLGWSISPEDDVPRGYAAAAEHAIQDAATFVGPGEKELGALGDLDLSGVALSPGPCRLQFAVPRMPSESGDVRWRRLRILGGDLVSDRAPGSRIVGFLGDRIGPVWIGTGHREGDRGYRSGKPTLLPVASAELAEEVGRVIHDRNLATLARMERQAGIGGEEAMETVRSLLGAVAGHHPD